MKRGRVRRRIICVLVYLACSIAILWLSILPAALRAGAFHHTIETRLSKMLGCPVALGTLDLPEGRELHAQQITLTSTVPGVGPITLESVRIRFRGLALLGTVEYVTIDGVSSTVEISDERIREFLRPRPTQGTPTPSPPFHITGPLELPPVRISRIAINGQVASDRLDIRDAEFHIDPTGPLEVLFSFTGQLASSPDPTIDVRGALGLTSTSSRIRFDRVKFGTLAADLGLELPRPASAKVRADVHTFGLPHALTSLLESFTGIRAEGIITTACTLTIENGALSTLSLDTTLAEYEVLRGEIRAKPSGGPSQLRLELVPESGGGWHARGQIRDLELQLARDTTAQISSATYETHLRHLLDDAWEGTLSAHLARASLNLRGYPQTIDEAHLEMTGHFATTGRADFQHVTLAVGSLGQFTGSGWVERSTNGFSCDVTIESSDLAMASLGIRLAEALNLNDLSMDGTLGVSARFVAKPDTGLWCRVTGKVGAAKAIYTTLLTLSVPSSTFDIRVEDGRLNGSVDFTDISATYADIEASKVEGRVAFDFRTDPALDGSATLHITRAELLKGELYQEISPSQAVHLTLAGRFDTIAKRYTLKDTSLAVDGIGQLVVHGLVEEGPRGMTYDLALKTDEIHAAAVAERIASLWSLEGLELKGSLLADLHVVGEGPSLALEGPCTLRGVQAKYGDVAVTNLCGELPLVLARGRRIESVHSGWIEFDDLTPCAGVALGKQRLELSARENELQAPGKIFFPLWGGSAALGEVSLFNLQLSPRVDLKVGADGIDLAHMARAFALKRSLAGTATLPWGPILVSTASITLTRPVSLALFEGSVTLENIRILKPLDSVHRATRFGFAMKDIRLSKVCETLTEFGVIDGVANASGQIELHKSGLPNWLQIEMRTERHRDVEQVCNLQAVRALAMITGGPEMAAMLERLPAERLYYKRFGFYAAMDVDFTLYPRGLWFQVEGSDEFVENNLEDLKRGRRPTQRGKEFIMIGKGMTRVNINILNPGGGVDFNDIIERFKQVQKK